MKVRMKSRIRAMQRIGLATVVILTMLFSPCQADAFSQIDIHRAGSITITENIEINKKTEPISSLELRIWKVADVTEGVRFNLTGEFGNSGVQINGLDAEGFRDAADCLSSYIKKEQIQTFDTGITDSNGKLTFRNLSTGMYLISPSKNQVYLKGYNITLEHAMLVSVPYQVSQDDGWMYDVPVEAKNEAKLSPSGTVTTYSVHKIWKDDNNAEGKRPQHIYIRLLQNGQLYGGEDGVICLAGSIDGWEYVWKQLPDGYSYTVEEINVPDGYISSVSGNVITNTLETGDPNDPENPRESYGLPPERLDDIEKDGNIPKTGDESPYLFYILMMAISGGGLICLAIIIKKKKKL